MEHCIYVFMIISAGYWFGRWWTGWEGSTLQICRHHLIGWKPRQRFRKEEEILLFCPGSRTLSLLLGQNFASLGSRIQRMAAVAPTRFEDSLTCGWPVSIDSLAPIFLWANSLPELASVDLFLLLCCVFYTLNIFWLLFYQQLYAKIL